MRKFGLIAAIVGFGMLGADLVLRLLVNVNSWLWLPGFLALAGGAGLILWSRWASPSPVVPAPKAMPVNVSDTARLLDNFEQRFAELKGRKPSVNVITPNFTPWAPSSSSAAGRSKPPRSTGTSPGSTTPSRM
jgi:hypothetical protein